MQGVDTLSLQTDKTLSLPIVLAWFRLNMLKIALGGVVCGLLSIPITLTQTSSYNSSVTLMVSPPVFKEGSKSLSSRDPSVLVDSTIAEMMPQALPVETYKLIALSAPVLAEVIRKVPLETTIQGLQGNLKVELVRMGASGRVTYSRTIIFHANARSPELAAKTAQTWAEVFKEQVDAVAAKGVHETFSLLDTLHTDMKKELEEIEVALGEHRKLWNLELIKAQLSAKQEQYTTFEGTLKDTEVQLASREGKMKALEEELAKEPQKIVYFRAPSDDAYWITGDENGGNPSIDPERGLRTEQPNANYVETRASVVESKKKFEGSKAKREAILAKLSELEGEIKVLSATNSDRTIERTLITREHDSLKASYVMVRAEYEKGRMADRTKVSDIVIASEAVPLAQPGGPGKAKVFLLAAFVGMVALGGFIMLKDLSEIAISSSGGGGLGALMARASSSPDTPEDAPKEHENSD